MRSPGRGRELPILVGLLVAVLSVLGFGMLASEMAEGETRAFDERILLTLHAQAAGHGPWLTEAWLDVTALGSVVALTTVTIATVGFLLIRGHRREGLLVLSAVIGGELVTTALKHLYGRPRPDLVPHDVLPATSSFPSGHASMSAVVYLTLGALIARFIGDGRGRTYCVAVAALLSGAIGISRVVLGVHWPTDVVAGWAVGLAWAIASWLVVAWLEARGHLGSGRR